MARAVCAAGVWMGTSGAPVARWAVCRWRAGYRRWILDFPARSALRCAWSALAGAAAPPLRRGIAPAW
eukprot:7455989-Alexandrium_andersonii.AAC.1